MWLTLSFPRSVCFCVYIYVPTPGGPCTLLFIGRACDGPTSVGLGENLLRTYPHQFAVLPLFLWAYRQGETVNQSVAKGMYYIMARFFVWWCNLNMMHKIPLPPLFLWSLITALIKCYSYYPLITVC